MGEVVRVVVIGGGFGGVYTAQRLMRARRLKGRLEVHLVNRDNYMVFQPMLPELISGSVGLVDTVTPIRQMVPGVHLHTREVESIDLEARRVSCSPGLRPRPLVLEYDHLVLATGTVTDFRGMPGVAEHARPFKTLGDALALRNHTIGLLEEADTEADPQLRRQMLTFVVAGGGFSGVEAIAELQDFVRRVAPTYPGIRIDECRFILLHSQDRILPEMSPGLALYGQQLLQDRGVEIRLGARLSAATRDEAILQDGARIPTCTLISTVPSHPNPLVERLGLPTRRGRILVDGELRVQGHDNLWAVGDCALVPLPAVEGEEVSYAPPTAQHAIRQAAVLGDNLVATVEGRPRRTFTFKGLGMLAALGHHRGVAEVMGIKLSGFLAFLMWRGVYWSKIPGIDRKLRVGTRWLLDLVFPPDLVQLKVGGSAGVRQEHFEEGQFVFQEGDLGDRVYIIVQGEAEVLKEGQVLNRLGPGQYFGEIALLNRTVRSASIRCTRALDVLSIEKGDFSALVSHLGELKDSFTRTASQRQERDEASGLEGAAPASG